MTRLRDCNFLVNDEGLTDDQASSLSDLKPADGVPAGGFS